MSQSPANLVAVHCPCGAKLRVKPEGLGRKARCPKCSEVFVVSADAPLAQPERAQPARPAPDSLLDELAAQERTAQATAQPKPTGGARACPQCGNRMPADAVVCVSCGYNLQTGKTMKQASAKGPVIGGAVRRLAKGAGTFALGCVLAGVAALVGAGVWCAVTMKTGYEIGWVAWGLGVAVGVAMHAGYRKHDARAGVVAAGIAGIGVFAAKVLVFVFVLRAIVTGNTNDRELQREFLRQTITAEILDDRELWSDEERESQWESAYQEASAKVERMSDQDVGEQVAQIHQEEERRQAAFTEGGPTRMRLAHARATRRAEQRGLSLDDPRRDRFYNEELDRTMDLEGPELAAVVAELDQWNAKERWEDEQYVRDHLVYQLIDRETRGDMEYEDEPPPLSHNQWNAMYTETCAAVDAWTHEERCERAKQIEHEIEADGKRYRLAYHRTYLEELELGVRYDADEHAALMEEHLANCETMADADLDAAIADLERWEEGAKWDDPAYVRNHLIELHINQAMEEHYASVDPDSPRYYDPDAEQWKQFREAAVARADAVPVGQQLAQIHEIERQQEKQRAEAAAKADWEETREVSGELAGAFFSTMFGPVDVLFVLLALGSAYSIAAGRAGSG